MIIFCGKLCSTTTLFNTVSADLNVSSVFFFLHGIKNYGLCHCNKSNAIAMEHMTIRRIFHRNSKTQNMPYKSHEFYNLCSLAPKLCPECIRCMQSAATFEMYAILYMVLTHSHALLLFSTITVHHLQLFIIFV